MSFFPDSEMHKLHPQQYYDTPPTPEYTYEPSYASTVSTSESHPPIDSTFSSWESSKNRGLGLLPTKSSGPSSISNFLPQGSPTSSFVWAPFLPSQSQNQSIPEFRREMWVDTPVSSNVSNGMWSTLPLSSIEPTSGSMFDHSEYSTSCAASDYSSPYAPSALLDDNHAPRIKLESPFETSCSPKSQYEQLGSVNPMDIVTCAPPATPRMVFTPLLTPLTPLPTASQSASPQPMKLELDSEGRSPGETRNKRSYTTPEDAKCSCKQCGKLFKRASNLAAHMQTHDEQRDHPWACRYDDCDKRFNRRTDMERHTRSVSRSIPLVILC